MMITRPGLVETAGRVSVFDKVSVFTGIIVVFDGIYIDIVLMVISN